MNRNAKLFVGFACLSLALTACKKDFFNIDSYDVKIKQAFPVDSVSADQTWATFGAGTANISINGNTDQRFRVAIYKENPLYTSPVTLLAADSLSGGESTSLTFSFELVSPRVYVVAYDELNRRVVEAATITDKGTINVDFFGRAFKSRTTRAAESQFPYYARSAQDYLGGLTVSDMEAYTPLSDANILNDFQGKNLQNPSYDEWGKPVYYGDGHNYRIPFGTTVTESFSSNGRNESNAIVMDGSVIYVEGILHLSYSNKLSGVTIVVGNGGEVVLDGVVDLSNKGRFVVLSGGKISSAASGSLKVSKGAKSYNAGEIDYAGELNMNGSDFYNCGTLNVSLLRNTSGGKMTNFGTIVAGSNMFGEDTSNYEMINGCYWHYTSSAAIGKLTMLTNSRLDVDGFADFTQSATDGDPTAVPFILMDKSLINVNMAFCGNTVFLGPTGSGEFAIVKMNKVQVANGDDIVQSNNCYFDWDVSEIYSTKPGKGIISEKYTGTDPTSVNQYVKYHISKFVQEATALPQFSITAGDCTGAGYNVNPSTPVSDIREDEIPNSYRFCFEAYFPSADDNDFNDCVMTITPVVNGNTATVTISLDAVGASKQLAAALRIKNLMSYQLKSVTRSGFEDVAAKYEEYKIIKPTEPIAVDGVDLGVERVSLLGRTLNTDGKTYPNYNNLNGDQVFPIFNDAHWVMSGEGRGANIIELHKNYYNTFAPSSNSPNKVTAPKQTVTFTFEVFDWTKDAIQYFNDVSNYDLFLLELYDGRIWEVHTYPYKFDQVLGEYAVESGKLDVYAQSSSARYPWAIQVPASFKYPIEGQSISMSKSQSSGRPAYPNFKYWAADPVSDAYKNWYEKYNKGLVYDE